MNKGKSWLRLENLIIRAVLGFISIGVIGIVLFAFLPVPFSAVMAERQVGAWLCGNFSFVAHSDWIESDDISPWMKLAVIASEDQKFPVHRGFDIAAIKSVLNGGSDGHLRGASTISQQTAKNVFLWEGRSWLRKGLEAGLTVGIETVWNKRRILTIYLNVAEFGKGVFGVEEASRQYFHKPASKITFNEAALLASVLPNPGRFHVEKPTAYLRQRQQWILHQMRQLGGEGFLREHNLL